MHRAYSAIKRLKFFSRLLYFAAIATVYALQARFCSATRRKSEVGDEDEMALVFISTHPFAGLWQRPQQIAVRAALNNHVLYFWPSYASDLARGRASRQRPPSEYERRVRLLCPPLLPFERASSIIYRINLRTACLAIERELARMQVTAPPLLWFYAPRFAPLLDSLDNVGVVYDIMDEHSAFGFARKETALLERRLLTSADAVFAGTYTLAERKKEFAPNIKYFPCGVEFAHFSKAMDDSLSIPELLEGVDGPVIGYFGAVDDRIDFDAIFLAAKSHPDWTIVLAGPYFATRPRSEFARCKNVLLPGLVDYSELPSYLKRFDVAILPFVLSELTLHIHPTKVLEYLSSRTPVVSTPIPDVVRFYKGIVRIAKTSEEFVQALDSSLRETDVDAIERGFEMARESSWDRIIGGMMQELEAALSGLANGSE
ncbi:glycosyltransferase [bacterium]|nr:glycosyltransferase [bacterium]